MKLIYTKDNSNNDILIDENDEHQIMMEWEKPYMEKCIELLEPSGSVLEIGFGLGYSAEKLCLNPNVISYNVIECSPVVWEYIEGFKQKIREQRPNLQINVIKGRWQDVIDTIDVYDSIFFDDYIGQTMTENNDRFNKFLYEILRNHSKIGTRISCYSTNNKLQKLDCIDIKTIEYKIEIPSYCEYAKGTKMFIPLIEKIAECKEQYTATKNQMTNPFSIPTSVPGPVPVPKMNFFVIDNFYTNPIDTRNYALEQDFTIIGDFIGKRTISFVNDGIKSLIQEYIKPCGGNITDFPMEKTDTNFNGCYQYTTANDRSYIQKDNRTNNWIGILYLFPIEKEISGTNIYLPINNISNMLNTDKLIEFKKNFKYDTTMWKINDTIGNKFNRLLLFRSNQYYSCVNHFGNEKEKEKCRLIQFFNFTTER